MTVPRTRGRHLIADFRQRRHALYRCHQKEACCCQYAGCSRSLRNVCRRRALRERRGRDGAFGIGIDASATKAIAAAKSRCEDSAREASNCGSHLTVTRGSWTLAHRCGDQPLIVTSAYLDEAEQLMLNSEIEQQLHFDNAAQCRHLVTVDPAGNVTRRHGLPTPSGAALPKR
jgi:hypothetical protein